MINWQEYVYQLLAAPKSSFAVDNFYARVSICLFACLFSFLGGGGGGRGG